MTQVIAIGLGHWHSFSTGGLLLGTLFFAASLTPSLLPRTFLTQGVLSGCSLAGGYGIGVFGHWLWTYMELPQPKDRLLRIAKLAAAYKIQQLPDIVFNMAQSCREADQSREALRLYQLVASSNVDEALQASAIKWAC